MTDSKPETHVTEELAARCVNLVLDLTNQSGGFEPDPTPGNIILEPSATKMLWELAREIMALSENG